MQAIRGGELLPHSPAGSSIQGSAHCSVRGAGPEVKEFTLICPAQCFNTARLAKNSTEMPNV